MKILVTGAAGFIGYHLSAALLSRGDEVVGIDSLNDYYDPALKRARLAELGIRQIPTDGSAARSSLHPGFQFRLIDLTDTKRISSLFEEFPFDRVVNLGAQAGVRYSIENPGAYIQSNIAGFLSILEACRAARTPHLVYASSSSVYGLNDTRPFSIHDHTDHPASLYAATKKSNELMAHTYSHLYNLPTTGLRFFTVYGPWGRPDMAYYKFASAISEGRVIDVYNNGDMYRDFTYIDDIVEGVIRTTDRVPEGDPGWDASRPDPSRSRAPYRVYNIGNNSPVRLGDFVAELERALGKKARIRYLPMQPGDVYATEADISDLEKEFAWKPSTPIGTGLARFASWFNARHTGVVNA